MIRDAAGQEAAAPEVPAAIQRDRVRQSEWYQAAMNVWR